MESRPQSLSSLCKCSGSRTVSCGGTTIATAGTSGTAKTTLAVKSFLSHLDELSNEHYLFHGSSSAAVESITESGFPIDLAGNSAGVAFGRGAYFAEVGCPRTSSILAFWLFWQ
eukprot:3871201-Amphidinium_carterae.1